jgi:nitroimidazol reductase NimA-like FMN-containing flavoprotein (pyridoxamine 5'-phosphate oxidase superfamily)
MLALRHRAYKEKETDMPRTLTEQERQDFLAEVHVAVLSVASDDGRPPHAVPVWYAYQPGGDITFFTGTQRRATRKTRLIEKAGGVSVTVQRETYPYKYVSVEGEVVKVDQPPAAEDALAVVRRYLPEEVAQGVVARELEDPESVFVLYTVRPRHWRSFDFTEEAP